MKFTNLTLLLTLIIVAACVQEPVPLQLPETSHHRELVESYLSEIRTTSDEQTKKLSDLASSINYKSVFTTKVSDNEDMLLADVDDYKLNASDKARALFFIQDGAIVRSNLVSVSANVKDQHGTIISILKSRFNSKGFTGRVGFYNVFGEVLFYNSATNGHIDENGMIMPRKGKSSSGKVSACIDWYLVTTYYYSSGASYKTEAYVYTTCDGECQGTRQGGRINCGGGGGGTYTDSPSFPANANDGDMREWTDKDGVNRVYMFSSVANMWMQVSMTLGNVVIQANPITYSFLLFDSPPPDKSIVTAAADTWVYDAWGGKWTGDDDFPEVQVEQSRIINNRPAHFDCFSSSHGATLTAYADQPIANTVFSTQGTEAGHAFITLDQVINGVHYTRTFGFYPETGANPVNAEANGVLANDEGHEYDVSVTVTLSAGEVATLLGILTGGQLPEYHLRDYNCVSFVLDACGASGATLPENISWWWIGMGYTPGRFGQDMRNWDVPNRLENHDNDGGTAPQDYCP
jgi:hypothetical protein